MWGFIFFLVAVVCGYFWYKNYKIANQNSVTANQNVYMVLFYSQMLYFLTEQKKFKEVDYLKLIASIWDVDSNLLDAREFNPKWEKICEVLKVPLQYTDASKWYLSDKLVPIIASRMFNNRHLFQQYGEQSERSRKISEKIMNDSYKY